MRECLDEVCDLRELSEFLSQLLKVVGGLGGLNEPGIWVDEAFNKSDTLLNSINSDVVLLNKCFILLLGKLTFASGSVPGLLSFFNEIIVTLEGVSVVLLGWVESIEEMHVGNSDPRGGVHDTQVDFLVHSIMRGEVDLVVFLLGLDLEPKVTDDLLERSD